MNNIQTDPGQTLQNAGTQMQVSVLRKSQEAFKQEAMNLINATAAATNGKPSSADPPHVGKNLDVVA